MIRALQAATRRRRRRRDGADDRAVRDIREYAVKLFENHGRGIGEKGKDNGVLILLAVKERRVWIEVGYDLEQWITDGFAGETSRDVHGAGSSATAGYGAGLLAGTTRIVGRIAQGRNVDARPACRRARRAPAPRGRGFPCRSSSSIFIAHRADQPAAAADRARGVRRWGRGGWSGWSSGVGPFGGGVWAAAGSAAVRWRDSAAGSAGSAADARGGGGGGAGW